MCDTEAAACSCVYEFIEAGFGPEMPEPPAPKKRPLGIPRRLIGVGEVLVLGDPYGADGHETWEIVHLTPEYAYYEASEVCPWASPSDNFVRRFRRDERPIHTLSPKLTGHYSISSRFDSLVTEGLD